MPKKPEKVPKQTENILCILDLSTIAATQPGIISIIVQARALN